MSIVIFLLVLGLLIFVHELGHFLAAKKSGVEVHEFALGFPPTILKKKIGETTYKLNLLPFGGYVSLEGENGEPAPEPPTPEKSNKKKKEETKEGPKETINENSFANKGPLAKTFILIAGVTMNMLLAWLLLSVGFMIGYPTTDDSDIDPRYIVDRSTLVLETLPNSPAKEAGLLAGDSLISLSDDTRTIGITQPDQVGEFINSSESESIKVVVNRNGEEKTIKVIPTTELSSNEEGEEERKLIGIVTDNTVLARFPAHLALWHGLGLTWDVTTMTAEGIVGLIKDAFRGQADMSGVAGPIGIVRLVGDAYAVGFVYLLSFTAIISVNLAIINLIPIPALDGGRILFTWIEAIRGKSIPIKTQLIANGIGFALLILLMIFISVHDIKNLFIK